MEQSTPPLPPTSKPVWYRRKSSLVVGVIGGLAIIGGVKQAKDKTDKREREAQVTIVQHRTDSIARAHTESIAKARADSIAAIPPEQLTAAARKQHADSLQRVRDSVRVADSTTKALAAEQRAAERARATALANSQRAARGTAPKPYQGETYHGHQVFTGPRGGRYYINSKGNKEYI